MISGDYQVKIGMKLDDTELKSQLERVSTTDSLVQKVKIDGSSYSNVTKEVTKYKNELGNVITQTKYLNSNNETLSDNITKISNKTAKAYQGFGEIIGKVAKFASATLILDGFVQVLQGAYQTVMEMNKQLTEFKKVSDLSGESLDAYTQKAAEVGTTVGRTSSEIVDAATQFRKNGYNDEDSLKLSKVASEYQNIADTEVSAADSASFIISQIKAFNKTADDATGIIDSVNEVANDFSVGTNDLQNALTTGGAAIATYGNTYSQTIGLITAGTEIMVGKSSQVARGLSTIASRITKNSDALKEYGISTTNANGDLRSTYDILSDVAKKWSTMSNAQRTSLGNTLAGVNQYKVFAAVMTNFKDAVKATTTAENASGSAEKENAKYMESYEAKVNSIKASFQEWAMKGNGVVSMLLSLTSWIAKANNKIEFIIPTLTMIGAISIPKIREGLEKLSLRLVSGFKTEGISFLTNAIKALWNNIIGTNVSVNEETVAFEKKNVVEQASIVKGIQLNEVERAKHLNYKKTSINLLELTATEEASAAADATKTATTEATTAALNEEAVAAGTSAAATAAATLGLSLIITAVISLLAYLPKLAGKIHITASEAQENVKTTASDISSLETKIAKLENTPTNKRTAQAKELLKIYKLQLKALKDQEKEEQKIAAEKTLFGSTVLGVNVGNGVTQKATNQLSLLKYYIDSYNKAVKSGNLKNVETDYKQIQTLMSTLGGEYATMAKYVDYLPKKEQKGVKSLMKQYKNMLGTYDDIVAAQEGTTAATKEAEEETIDYASLITALNSELKEQSGYLDSDQSAYSTLSSAISQYNENGIISIDTYQSLMSMSDGYIELLFDEKGNMLDLSTAIKKVTDKRIDDMAVKKAQSLIDTAIENVKEGKTVDDLATSYNSATQSLWGFVTAGYTQAQLEGVNTWKLKSSIDAIQKWAVAAKKSSLATNSAASSTSNLSSATETATEKLNAIKDKYTQAIDYINNQLDAEIDKIKEEEDAAVDAVEAQIDALKDQQDAEDKYYQNKIDALNDANDALQDQIELEQYEEALAEAKSKKIKVLQNGSFTYSEDVDAVSKAQTDLANYNNKQAIQNQIDELENLKDKTKAALDTQIKQWETYEDNLKKSFKAQEKYYEDYKNKFKDMVDSYETNQNKLAAEELTGINFENNAWMARISNLQNFVNNYSSLLTQLANTSSSAASSIASTSGVMSDVMSDFDIKMQNIANTAQQFTSNGVVGNALKTVSSGLVNAGLADTFTTALENAMSSISWKGLTLPKFASGTGSVGSDEMAIVGDRDTRELVIGNRLNGQPMNLSKGTGVLPHTLTNQLMNILPNMSTKSNSVGGVINNYTFGDLTLPNVKDADSFANEIRTKFISKVQS